MGSTITFHLNEARDTCDLVSVSFDPDIPMGTVRIARLEAAFRAVANAIPFSRSVHRSDVHRIARRMDRAPERTAS